VDIGHTTIADVGAEPNVVGFSRRRTSNPVRRRALESRKSHRIDEIRKIMGMRDRTPKLQVLNAGAGGRSVPAIGLAIYRFIFSSHSAPWGRRAPVSFWE